MTDLAHAEVCFTTPSPMVAIRKFKGPGIRCAKEVSGCNGGDDCIQYFGMVGEVANTLTPPAFDISASDAINELAHESSRFGI
jgi:hypothetical protein